MAFNLLRPLGLVRYFGLDPLMCQDVLGTWNPTYLKETLDFWGQLFAAKMIIDNLCVSSQSASEFM